MTAQGADHPGPDSETGSVGAQASASVHTRFATTPAEAQVARERFAETASLIWVSATTESRRLQHFYLGVEHLFLGLAAHASGLIDQALGPWGVSADTAALEVESTVSNERLPSWKRIRVTPRARAILGLADTLCRQHREPMIQPWHLLAAILLEAESIPARVLQNLGVDLRQAYVRFRQGWIRASNLGSTPILDHMGTDLLAQARAGAFDVVVGRDCEIELVMEVLCRRTKNNPVLIGGPGVGKTAIVEAVATRLANGEAPPALQGSRLVRVSASLLRAAPGSAAEKTIRDLVEELRAAPDVILFVDEIHVLASQPGTDASALLKPALARGELRCVGATTTGEYRRFIEDEPALERRFQPVQVDEPGAALTVSILKGLRSRYEQYHGVTISDDALEACVLLSDHYLHDREQPDKAIDLMDQSAARVAIRWAGAVTDGDINPCESCGRVAVVVRDDVAGLVSDLTGVDVPASPAATIQRLRDLDAFLSERVLGQPEAVAAAAQLIRMAKRELDLDPGRPDGVLLLMGPAGTGKTSLACAIAEFLHGKGDDALVRLDMADYAEPQSLGRLIGSPPGYVGYDKEGQLTGRIRTQPDAVLLLDEIDRAHASIRSVFTQVFEEGRLTDSRGRCVHFDHTTIVLTASSDVGGDMGHAGFRHGDPTIDLESRARATLSNVLTMEFVSRIDRVIVLRPLSMAVITEIAAKMLRQVAGRLLGEGKTLITGDGVAEAIARQDYNARFGARHLARSVEALVLGPISTLSYSEDWDKASAVTLSLDGTSVKVDLAVR